MKYIATVLIWLATMLVSAETISNMFDEHFQVELPDMYQISYAGGKEGEKQFSLTNKKQWLISLFVYYDGLDPRKWSTYFDQEKDVFFIHKDKIFVYATLPTDMSDETKRTVRDILESIRIKNSKKLQPAVKTPGESGNQQDTAAEL